MSATVVNGILEDEINAETYENDLKSNNYTKTGLNNNDGFTQDEKMVGNNVVDVHRKSIDSPKQEVKLEEDIKLVSSHGDWNYENGPDQIIPSEKNWVYEADDCVRLKEGKPGEESSIQPISIPSFLHRTATKYPDAVALSYKENDNWKQITFREYEEKVRTVAKAFIELGLQRHQGVGIIGFNSPEWFLTNLGAIFAGGLSVGIYTTNSAEACQHCLEVSSANICVVEDSKQLEKILSIKNNLPHLKAIVQYSGEPSAPGVLSWEELLKIGEKQSDDKLNLRLKKIAINQCCTLIYTSGTEGKSKAVMLNHDNLTWDATVISDYIKSIPCKETIVSYLPLSHVAAQIADIYITIYVGGKVVFADKDALKGSLVKTLNEAKPTVFLGVPRVWEKIYEKMMAVGRETTGLKKLIATWGKSYCLDHHMNVMNGNPTESFGYKFYRSFVFSKVKAALGLDRTRNFLSAAAPLSVDIKKYFMSLDIPLVEAFGMSETSGGHTVSRHDDFRIDSLGRPLPGTETKLAEVNEEGQGEICMRGRHIFMGYLNEKEKTKAAIDSEGWIHSGDIGMLVNGHLKITGRLKELLITAGGENVPPVLIEHVVKKELPCISQAQLIGDRRKFLSILLTLKTEIDSETTEPLDELTKEVKSWCKSLGCEVNTVTEVLDGPKPEILAGIQAGIDRANSQAVSNAQKIQKFAILPKDFSLPTGELGPTLKLKRNVVYEKYKDIIENFYKE